MNIKQRAELVGMHLRAGNTQSAKQLAQFMILSATSDRALTMIKEALKDNGIVITSGR